MFIFGEDAVIPEKRQVCDAGSKRCESCVLNVENGGKCKGCSSTCSTKTCDTMCGTCGGHDPALVGAICCRSPLKDIALMSVNQKYKFKKVKPIDLKTKAVLTVIGGRSSVTGDDCPYIPEFDAIAVALRHVWSAGGGWYSRDLKDYMMIPKSKKLILLTSMYDDVLDKAWKADLFGGFKEIGFDYWCPLIFSVYETTARMYQWWNHKRTEYSLFQSEGHFYDGDILMEGGFAAEDEFREAMAAVPNVIVNMQMATHTNAYYRKVYSFVSRIHRLLPSGGTLWLTGVGNPRLFKVCLLAAPGRSVYTLSTAPWIIPHKGRLLNREGKVEKRRDMSKVDLLFQSQKNYVKMIEDCYDEVERLTK